MAFVGSPVHERFSAVFDRSLLRYLLVGGVAALTDWAIFWLLAVLYGYNYIVVATLGFVIATLVNYVLSIRFVFVSGRHKPHMEIFLVYLISAIGLLLNVGLLIAFVAVMALHPMVAKVLATAMVFIWNFGARKLWVFDLAT